MTSVHKALAATIWGLFCLSSAHAAPGASDWYESEQPQAGGRMSTSLSKPMALPRPVLADGSPSYSDARFDLTVNNAPAKQVFLQLGVGTSYNILVSPDIAGTITIGLKNTTVPEAMDVLRELFGYDYRISGNRVFVYPNSVQTRIFRVNYLPGRRQGASDLRVVSSANSTPKSNTGGSSSGTASGSSGSSTGNNNMAAVSISTSSDADFWRDVKESLVSMVGADQGRGVTINPGAGMIVVRATPAELRHVADYLRAVQLSIERQVMLEAKIIEVQLSKASEAGVNWSLFRGVSSGGARSGIVGVAPGISLSRTGALSNSDVSITPGDAVLSEALGKGFYGLAVQAANFTALISFLETQGQVQVLSSPRIATLNNQKAVLKVGSEERYVAGIVPGASITGGTTNSTTSTGVTLPTPDIQPFFSGISLDVTPQIDENGTVMLHVHPSVSAVSEKQKVIDMGELGTFKLPLAISAINETDSIVRVHDGHIVAIGGLMTEGSTSDRSGVPGLGDVPVMGGLFRYRSESSTKRELVILIRPTIISEDGLGWSSSAPETPMLGK